MAKRRTIPTHIRRALWQLPCAACGWTGDTVVDHIVPVSKGGENDTTNYQPLCAVCNHRKRDHIMSLDDLRVLMLERGRDAGRYDFRSADEIAAEQARVKLHCETMLGVQHV